MRKLLSLVLLVHLFITGSAGNFEELKFDLKFGIVKAGEAVLRVKDTTFRGVPAIQYYIEGRTTGVTDKFFKVYDIYETITDAQTHLPLKAVRNVKEKKYRYYNETFFYHDNDSIYSELTGGKKVPDDLLDIISIFFYYVKNDYTNRTVKGERISFPTFHADKIEDVSIKYLGVSVVDTDLGKIDCYVLGPSMGKGKLLKRSDGLLCFISKEHKIPVQMEFDMRVGAMRAIIRSYAVNGVERFI